MASQLLSFLVLAFFQLTSAELRPRSAKQGWDPNLHWVDTWASMPQLTEFANLPPPPFVSRGIFLSSFHSSNSMFLQNETNEVFFNSTIRQTIHTSIGANTIRIRISNAFGLNNLPITSVTVALPDQGAAGVSAIQPKTLQTVTFSGNTSFTIPNGAFAVSDPISFSIKPQSNLAVTMYLANGQQSNYITSHPGSRTTSYFSFGNYVHATNLTDPSTQTAAHWYQDLPHSTDSFANRWDSQVLPQCRRGPGTSTIFFVCHSRRQYH